MSYKQLIGACMMLGVSVAFALPSLSGISGLVNMPTAEALRYKEFNSGFAFQGDGTNKSLKYFTNVGIFNGVEVGFIGDTSKEGVYINLKYYMLSDKSDNPLALAFGLTNVSSWTNTSLFLALSKRLKGDIGVHFGFNSNISSSTISPSLMLGGDVEIAKNLVGIAEVIGGNSDWAFSTGARYFLNTNVLLNFMASDVFKGSRTISDTFSIGIALVDFM